MALATADVGAGAGLGATRLEGRCLHPPELASWGGKGGRQVPGVGLEPGRRQE